MAEFPIAAASSNVNMHAPTYGWQNMAVWFVVLMRVYTGAL
jgi:hypothetical protein